MPDQKPWGFFSYSRHDSAFVLKLAKDLRAAGASVWLDQLDITPGQHWDSAIEKALGDCPHMLVILSPDSVESTNVMDEVSFALEENKIVIPVLYRDCKVPFRLRRLQYVDARIEYDNGLAQLLGMLGIHASGKSDISPAPAPRLEEHMRTLETEAGAAEKERINQERLVDEKTEAGYRPKEKSPAEAHERELATQERIAHEKAEQERMASQKQEFERQSAARVDQHRGDRSTPTVTTGSSRTRYIIGAAVAVVVILLVWAALPKSHPPSSVAENRIRGDVPAPENSKVGNPSTQASQEPPSQHSTEKESKPDVTQWVQEFLVAGEGPTVSSIRPFYDDVVSPYFGQQTATWEDIAKDKEAYFRRFPSIHYALLGPPELINQPEGTFLEFDMQFSNLRKDGRTLEGKSHLILKVRSVDGRWRITGISERTATR